MHPRKTVFALAALAALASAAPASAEVVLRRVLYGEFQQDRFGSQLAPAGDADGDGRPDFAIVANRGSFSEAEPRQKYYVVAAAGLRLLRRVQAADPLGEFRSVAGLGDWDGDGEDDLLVHEDDALTVRRGRTGEILALLPWPGDPPVLRAAPAGDADGDSVPDLIVAEPYAENGSGVGSGRARLARGADFSTILALDGEREGDLFGLAAAGGCDVNADGVPDVFAGAPGFDHSILGQTFDLADSGKAYVFSGADGALLHASVGDWQADAYGRAFACLGDADGDGFGDFAVGNPDFTFTPLFPDVEFRGSARLFSGKTGGLLRGFTPNPQVDPVGMRYGGALAGLGDFDGAGDAEVLVAARGGPLEIRTARTGALLARVPSPLPVPDRGFGECVLFLGGSGPGGRPAFAVGAPFADSPSAYGAGAVLIYEYVGPGESLCPGDSAAAALLLGAALKDGPENPVGAAVLCLRTLAGLASPP